MNNNTIKPNLKPVVPYMEHFLTYNRVVRPPESLDEIFLGLKVLFRQALKGDIAALRITQYLRTYLTNNELAARTSVGTDFEDFFALMFGGDVQDFVKKETPSTTLLDKNANKKKDIVFPTGLAVSIKTFVESNKEINLGAFSAEYLFEGILELRGERKQLGSKPQLLKAFKEIEANGDWDRLVYERFIPMVERNYNEDFLIVRKGNDNIDIYGLTKENLHFILIEAMKKGPESAIKVLNRFEGHSLRVSRDYLLSPQFAEYLGYNFGYTQGFKLDSYDEAKRDYHFKEDLGLATEEDFKELQANKPVLTEQKYTNVLHYSNFHKKIQNRFANGELDIHINFGFQQ